MGLLSVLIFVALAVSCVGDGWASQTQAFFSPVMGSHYSIQIAFPDGIDPAHPRPAVVLLDGNWYFDGSHWRLSDGEVLSLAMKLVEQKVIPQVLLIGVGFVNPEQRAEAFLLRYRHFHAFLIDELIPFLTATYPIDLDRIHLLGHSDGGFFTFYSFTQAVLGNSAFCGFVSLSPDFSKLTEDAYTWEAEARESLSETSAGSLSLFLGAGRREEYRFVLSLARMESRIESWPSESVRFQSMLYPNETHTTVVRQGFADGLSWLFETDW